jgi:hypothetical protein
MISTAIPARYSCRFAACVAMALIFAAVPLQAKQPNKPGAKHEAAIRMYRYKNDQGVMVTASTISPEYARKGYQVVNMSGVVLETIPPEPTAEERAQLEQNRQQQLSAAQQMEQDKQLLLRYTNLDELKNAKQRKLSEIDSKIKMLQGNISALGQQIEFEQGTAADFERTGRPVPPAQLQKIEALQQERKVLESQVVSRQQELAEETQRFDHEIERYTFLEQQRHGKQP